MQVTKISKQIPLRIQAYDNLKAAIVNGAMKPGDRLTEEGVAEELGVSRTPAREALSLLCEVGIVEKRKQGGYQIPTPSLSRVTEITAVRKRLEPYAARLIAERVGKNDLQEIREALDAEWQAIEDMTPGTFTAANRNFRNILCNLSGNGQLVECIQKYTDHLQFIAVLTLVDVETRKIAVNGHEQIYKAIAARDPDAAERAMLTQIEAAQTATEKALTAGDKL